MFEIAAVGLVESDTTHDSEKKGGRRERRGGEKGEKEKKNTIRLGERILCDKKTKNTYERFRNDDKWRHRKRLSD